MDSSLYFIHAIQNFKQCLFEELIKQAWHINSKKNNLSQFIMNQRKDNPTYLIFASKQWRQSLLSPSKFLAIEGSSMNVESLPFLWISLYLSF